jgi:tetratricopeptide (TPR) repeat protein
MSNKKEENKSKSAKMNDLLLKFRYVILGSVAVILAATVAVILVSTSAQKKADEISYEYGQLSETVSLLSSAATDDEVSKVVEAYNTFEDKYSTGFCTADFAFKLANFYASMDNYDSAIEYYGYALKAKPAKHQKNIINMAYGKFLLENGNIDDAYKLFKDLSNSKDFLYIDYVDFELARIYESKGDKSSAINHYNALINRNSEAEQKSDYYNIAKTRVMQLNLGMEMFKFDEKTTEEVTE